jgi:hypothetical protein
VVGGTAPSSIRAELRRWNKELGRAASAPSPVSTPR